MKIDFKLLAKQKLSLLTIISTLDPDSQLQQDMDSLLHLIDALQDEQEEKKTYYFLFGETACRVYHEEEFEEVIRQIAEEGCEFGVHKFIEGEHPENIMEAASGWMDHAMITKEEYEQLKEQEA